MGAAETSGVTAPCARRLHTACRRACDVGSHPSTPTARFLSRFRLRAGASARSDVRAPADPAPPVSFLQGRHHHAATEGRRQPGRCQTLPSRAGRRAGGLFVGLALLLAPAAVAHDARFTREENAWLNRQRAVDGTKCCDEHDVTIGLRVRWRMVGGAYQVQIAGQWRDVPPGRIMQHIPGDPSPFEGQALLFHTNGILWCFSPEPLT